jgi:hypothetical protein
MKYDELFFKGQEKFKRMREELHAKLSDKTLHCKCIYSMQEGAALVENWLFTTDKRTSRAFVEYLAVQGDCAVAVYTNATQHNSCGDVAALAQLLES